MNIFLINENQVEKLYKDYQTTEHSGKRCGLKALDKILRMDKKNLAVLTAKPNQGKSTFINFYAYLMAKSNYWKTLYFNFETDNGRFINDLVNLYGDIAQVNKYCTIVDTNKLQSLDDVFEAIREAKKAKDIDMCVIDPFMRLNNWFGEINTYNIGKVLTQLQQMAIDEDILLLIAAHPTKIKEGLDINPNDIMGSTYFYTVSDFIFSLNIIDREKMLTEIRTLKIRNNLDMGICGADCKLQFNPITKHYEEVDDDILDVPFSDTVAKQIMEEITNIAPRECFNSEVDNNTTQGEKTQQEENESEIEPFDTNNIMVGVFKNCNMKVPRKFVTLKVAAKLGEEQKDIIDKIRLITDKKENGWENEKRQLKLQLQCLLPSVRSRNRRIDEDTQYNNIICFDIDEKDNSKYEVNELKEILKNDPYVLYLSESCSGRGVYGYFIGNGNINDYSAQFDAMAKYFERKYQIVIDNAAKDITRLRFASYDINDYWNVYAEPFTSFTQTTHHQGIKSNNNLGVQKRTKLLDEEEKWLNGIIEEIKRDNLILSKNHSESNAIGLELAYYFGCEGLEYYLTIRSQRKDNYSVCNSTDKYYNICKWLDTSDYSRKGYLQTIRHYYYRAISEKENKDAATCNCGVFRKSN